MTLVRDVALEIAARRSGARRARRQAPRSPSSRRWNSPRSPGASPKSTASTPARSRPIPAFVGAGGWRGRNGEAVEPPRRRRPPASQQVEDAAPPAPDGSTPARRFAAASACRGARSRRSTAPPMSTVTTREELQRWIDEAFEAGVVAFDTETSSLDPMQADLVGFSLCVAPGRACYVPLGHRSAGERRSVRRRRARCPARSPRARRSRC